MFSLRTRLILSHIAPLLVVVPLVGTALLYLLQTQVLLEDLAQDLTQQATWIGDLAVTRPGVWSDEGEAENYLQEISNPNSANQFAFLTADGLLLAASDDTMRAQRGRQVEDDDVLQAMSGKPMTRHQANTTQVVIPVLDENNQVAGIILATSDLASASEWFNQFRAWVLGLLALQLVVGLGLALLLATSLERPLHNIADAIEQTTQGAIEPIPAEGPKEVQNIATSFNALTERLQFLEETRQRLLANLVHELGRPLGALRAAIHALKQGGAQDVEFRDELLTGMETEIGYLEPLLDDLSQLHSQVIGPLELDRRDTPMADWLPTLLPSWREKALQKGLQWHGRVPSTLPTLRIDPGRVAQAIGNLLSNAVKYTEPGDRITVAAGTENSETWIRVSDTGLGLTPEEQSHIFEPFYRAKHQRFPQGLGLGLTIARDLVESHGGRLEVNSAPGRGSHFTIFLPPTTH